MFRFRKVVYFPPSFSSVLVETRLRPASDTFHLTLIRRLLDSGRILSFRRGRTSHDGGVYLSPESGAGPQGSRPSSFAGAITPLFWVLFSPRLPPQLVSIGSPAFSYGVVSGCGMPKNIDVVGFFAGWPPSLRLPIAIRRLPSLFTCGAWGTRRSPNTRCEFLPLRLGYQEKAFRFCLF